MSQHNKTDFRHFTKAQMDAGLKLHGLEAKKPSQLSDAFRSGADWGAGQPVASEPSSGERASIERMVHDFPALSEFYAKHALGPMMPPSCLCCGQQTNPITRPVAVKHMELPGIVICKHCRDAALLSRDARTAGQAEPVDMVSHMVNRFLGWKLPKDFFPDSFISFDRDKHDAWGGYPNSWPTGTNLLTAEQAKAMIEYMLDGYTAQPAPQAVPVECKECAIQPCESCPDVKPRNLAPQAAPGAVLEGCACRWDKEDNRVQTCERHQGWLDVVHEWAERSKAAESALLSAATSAPKPQGE